MFEFVALHNGNLPLSDGKCEKHNERQIWGFVRTNHPWIHCILIASRDLHYRYCFFHAYNSMPLLHCQQQIDK